MSEVLTIPFDNSLVHSFDSNKIEVTGGVAKLKLQQGNVDFTEDFADDIDFTYDNTKAEFSAGQVQQKLYDITGQSFIEDFADDSDFVYDSDLAEFVAGQVRQKNKRPADAIFYIDFTDNSEDADWTDVGTGVGTLSDGATVHDGKLDLTGYVGNRRLSIDAYNTSHNSQKGCMRCLITPEYSGAPSQLQYIMQWRDGGLENNIQVLQNTSRFMQVWIRDGNGSNILATASFGVYDFVAGQEYEIEFNWDCDAGEHRLFIDGVQQGSTQSGTGTRDGRIDQFDFGVYYNNVGQPNFSIRKFIYYNAVQHTTDYTPDWSDIYSYDYVVSKIELPIMTYSGTQIKEFIGAASTESGSPKYVLDDKYWNGASWVASDGSYAQANTVSEINTNISSLTPTGATLNIDIVFDNSSSQSAVDNLQINYTGSTYLETSVILPEMEHTGDGTIKLFNSFTTTESGSPRYTLQIGRSGDYLYWDGAAWSVSDGTYAQANDAATFNTNCGSLPVDGEDYGQFKIIFPDSVSQSFVDELTANMNVDIGYLTTNPTIEPDATFRTDELVDFLETATKAGNDEFKYIFEIDGLWYWLNAGVLTETDGETYFESNTETEILTYIALIITKSSDVKIKVFIHSDDGSTTPELDTLTLTYSYGGETPDTINTCIVWGYIKDSEGVAETTQIKIKLNKSQTQYKTNTTIRNEEITITPDDSGYWEAELTENENMEEGMAYLFDFNNGRLFELVVPNQETSNFYDLEELA